MGLTHMPAAYLGDAVYVELPPLNAEVASGEPVGLVESASAVCEVVAPVSGVIIEINPAADGSPQTITSDPYGQGWLLVLRPTAPAEMDALLGAEDYDRRAGEE